ncbi:DUF2799 domain-containing protein [Morganella morganii]|uniref:DUF2799 domain-containing protein n=1 Tax=Morganella morganii TaxID=582 RepID=UPI001BD91443|nr:DUF2799 domain-containing protein [Morganella morganii]MBT0517792.1 DUF2799 domain-containing protein [Morganella morganii subsp. morganii]QWL90227.1 DUF2799 domain-containing protein [Morganella morganii subsp. morganii]
MMKKGFLVIFLLPLLSGCMSDEEWHAMQVSRQAAGEREICKKGAITLGRDYALAGIDSAPGLAEYRALCEKHDFVIDRSQWDSGYKSGSRQYCEPLQAYNTGKQNYTYQANRCQKKPAQISQLNSAWQMGLHWSEINRQISELEKSYDDLDSTIRNLEYRKDNMSSEDAREARHLLRRLKQEQADSERILRQYRSRLSAPDTQNLSAIVRSGG